MKKVILFVLICIGLSSFSMAQSGSTKMKKQEDKTKIKQAKTATPGHVTAMPKQEAKTAAVAGKSKPAETKSVVLKKDGTPDKRYKSKEVTTGPLKKDGTPDMRFKSNKKNR